VVETLIKTTLDVFCIDELNEFEELVLEVVDLLRDVVRNECVEMIVIPVECDEDDD